MKTLKVGVVNTISFVKAGTYTVNSFDITLEKVVGTGSLTLSNLQDVNGLDSCTDFITLNIDLVVNDLDGGEYYLTVTNGSSSYKYLTNVIDYTSNNRTGGLYSDTVVFTDL